MRILITGREGQVARAIAGSSLAAHELIFANRPELDLEDPASIEACVARTRPELIVSAAAYTAVDKAEDHPESAERANAEAPAILAHAARKSGAPLIHLSTDYVFDGSSNRPWREDDGVAPLGVYGRTKARGEEAVRSAAPDGHAIVRTAWVYSPWGSNFVRTMLRLADSGHDTVRVVADQIGCPTSAHCIASGIDAIVRRWMVDGAAGTSGTYHLAGDGEASWAEFAEAIFAASGATGGLASKVVRIPSTEYPTRAARPANSRLDCTRFAETFHFRAQPWRNALQRVMEELSRAAEASAAQSPSSQR